MNPDHPRRRKDDLWPAPWPTARPPFARLAAAGMGEFYGATIRQLDIQRQESAGYPVKFAQAQIEAAQARDIITDRDARRLLAYLNSGQQGGEGHSSAAKLFNEALDDPSSSQLALSILSIAKYEEAATTEALSHGRKAAHGILLGVAMMLGSSELVLAMYVAEHVTVTWD